MYLFGLCLRYAWLNATGFQSLHLTTSTANVLVLCTIYMYSHNSLALRPDVPAALLLIRYRAQLKKTSPRLYRRLWHCLFWNQSSTITMYSQYLKHTGSVHEDDCFASISWTGVSNLGQEIFNTSEKSPQKYSTINKS